MHEKLEQARDFWDRSAAWDVQRAIWDNEVLRDEKARDRAFDEAGVEDARFLSGFLHPAARVLDLGCGIGRVMRPLATHCREIIGVDISEKMIEKGHEYLATIDNARLVQTDGCDLPTVGDGSIDFLFSLICLIHVDKRAAFRYLREIRRVLAPDGLAHLQFENLLSDEGIQEFQRVVDLDHEYPLEFYTLEEVRQLARAAGLDVLNHRLERQFLFVTLVAGSAKPWIRDVSEGLRFDTTSADGAFQGVPGEGRIVGTLASTMERVQPLRVEGVLRQAGNMQDFIYHLEGQLIARPGATHTIEFVHHADGTGSIEVDGHSVGLARCNPGSLRAQGEVELMAGFAPPGFPFTSETVAQFPRLFLGQPISGELR